MDVFKTLEDNFKTIRDISALSVYSSGFITQLAIAWCVLFPMLKKGCDLSRVTHVLYAAWGVLALCALLLYFMKEHTAVFYKKIHSSTSKRSEKRMKEADATIENNTSDKKTVRQSGKIKNHVEKHRGRLFLYTLCAAMIIWSVFFVRPSADDATVETIRVNTETGTVYEYNPYSGDPYGGVSLDKIDAPIEVLYTVIMRAAGITNIRLFVEAILPAFLLLVFYAVSGRLGEILLESETQRKWFFFALLVFHFLLTFLKRDGAVQVFRNIWMDRTLLFAIVGPFLFGTAICFVRGEKMTRGEKTKRNCNQEENGKTTEQIQITQNRMKNLLLLLLGMLAAQMAVHAGFVLSLPFCIASIVTGMIFRYVPEREDAHGE